MSDIDSLETKLMEKDIIEAVEAINRDDLEGKASTLGINDEQFTRVFVREVGDNSFRALIQKFRNKHTGEIYEVAMTEYGIRCDCDEWNSRKCCKHIVYVFDKLSLRDEHGRIIGFTVKVTETPTYEEAKAMDFGRNEAETEKWHTQHLAVIEL